MCPSVFFRSNVSVFVTFLGIC